MSITHDKYGNTRMWVEFLEFIGVIIIAAAFALALIAAIAFPVDRAACNQRKEAVPQAGYVYRFPAGCLATNPDFVIVNGS